MNKLKGFTLIETMMTIGLASMMALTLTQMMVYQSKQLNFLYAKNSAQDLVSVLSTLLKDPNYCLSILKNKKYSSGRTTYLTSIIVPPIINISTNSSFSNLKILEIFLDPQPTDLRSGTAIFLRTRRVFGLNIRGNVVETVTSYLTNLRIIMSPLSDLSPNFQIYRSIPITFSTDNSNTIYTCLGFYSNSSQPEDLIDGLTSIVF